MIADRNGKRCRRLPAWGVGVTRAQNVRPMASSIHPLDFLAPAAEVARMHGLAHERTQLLPAGILVLDAAAQALGGRPLRIGRGGLREGVVLELAAS